MVEIVRVVHEHRKVVGSSYSVTRSIIPVEKVNMKIEGTKAVDSAEIVSKSKYISNGQDYGISVGDVVSVVTDDVDVNHLVGAYNFYYTLRDESGFNIDGLNINSTTPSYGVETNASSRYQGKKYLNCVSSAQSIELTQSTQEGNYNKINFNGGCEIQMWIKTPSTSNFSSGSKQIIYQRMDSKHGIEIGIEKSGSNYYMYWSSRITHSSSTDDETTIGDTDASHSYMQVQPDTDYFIRLWRQDDYRVGSSGYRKGVFKLSVNNRADTGFNYHGLGNADEYTLDYKDGTHITPYLCSDSAGGNAFRGRIYALRIYNQRMDDAYATRVYNRVIPALTMKFSGLVHQAEETFFGRVEMYCLGWGKFLNECELSTSISGSNEITNTLLETTISNIFTRVNLYANNHMDNTGYIPQDGKLGKDIRFEFSYNNPNDEDESGTPSWKSTSSQYHPRYISKILPQGKLIDLIRILAILGGKEYDSSGSLEHLNGADQFFMHPRKILIFESSEIDNHAYCSPNEGYSLYNRGSDSASLYNDVTVFGELKIRHRTIGSNSGFTNNQVVDIISMLGNPTTSYKQILGLRVIEYHTGTTEKTLSPVNEYEWDGKKITFTSSSSNEWKAFVDYVDLEDFGSVDGDDSNKDVDYPNYYNQRNLSSISKHGFKSFKMQFKQMEDITTTASLCRRILGERANPSHSVKIVSPRLSNSMWLGMTVTCTEDARDLHGEDFTIKSMHWVYESGKGGTTHIVAGDHNYDFLDQMNLTNEKIGSLMTEKSGTTQT